MNTPKKITINDVARLAGVSKKTVSRVINNEANVRDRTRERVEEMIKQLNYTPDPQARGLASRRSYLVALVYDNPNASFVTEAMYGVLDNCRSAGYELIAHPCNSKDKTLVEDVIGFVSRLKIDGVVLLPPISESEVLVEALRQADCHYVRLLSVASDDPAHMVHFNDREAVGDIADHLADLGHTNIGFIQGPQGSHSADERFEGFRDALAAHNISLPAGRIAKGGYTFQSGVESAEWLLISPNPPTAIFASNDEMALGAIVTAQKMGIKIPADLTIVGFDDSPHAKEVWPTLTTANLHVREMGRLAAEKLLALCNNNPEAAAEVQTELVPSFIQRQTTAPPSK